MVCERRSMRGQISSNNWKEEPNLLFLGFEDESWNRGRGGLIFCQAYGFFILAAQGDLQFCPKNCSNKWIILTDKFHTFQYYSYGLTLFYIYTESQICSDLRTRKCSMPRLPLDWISDASHFSPLRRHLQEQRGGRFLQLPPLGVAGILDRLPSADKGRIILFIVLLGDTSGCGEPPFDIKTTVLFWPGLAWLGLSRPNWNCCYDVYGRFATT